MLEDTVGNLTDCLKTSAFYTLDTTPPDAASVSKISPVGTVIREGANGDVDENPVLKEDMIVNIKFEDLNGEGELKVFKITTPEHQTLLVTIKFSGLTIANPSFQLALR